MCTTLAWALFNTVRTVFVTLIMMWLRPGVFPMARETLESFTSLTLMPHMLLMNIGLQMVALGTLPSLVVATNNFLGMLCLWLVLDSHGVHYSTPFLTFLASVVMLGPFLPYLCYQRASPCAAATSCKPAKPRPALRPQGANHSPRVLTASSSHPPAHSSCSSSIQAAGGTGKAERPVHGEGTIATPKGEEGTIASPKGEEGSAAPPRVGAPHCTATNALAAAGVPMAYGHGKAVACASPTCQLPLAWVPVPALPALSLPTLNGGSGRYGQQQQQQQVEPQQLRQRLQQEYYSQEQQEQHQWQQQARQAVQQEAGCGARPEYPVQAAVLASVANATALVQRALPQYQSRHKLTQVTLKLHQQHPEQLCGDVPEHLARILEDPSARSRYITSSAKPLLACDAVLLASVCVRPGCTLVVISLCQLTLPAGGSQQDSLLGSPLLTWLSGPGLMQTDTSASLSPPTAPADTCVFRLSSQQLALAEPAISTTPSPSPFAAEGAQAVREEQAAATLAAWPCVMSLPQPQPDLLTPPGAVGMTMVVQVLVHDLPWQQQQQGVQGVQVTAGSSWPSLPPGWRIEARLSSGVALAVEEAVEEDVETAAAEAAAEGGSEAAAGPNMWTGVDACTTGAAPGGKAIKVRLHLPPCPLPAGCLVVLELWREVPLTPPATNLANSTIASGNRVSSGSSSAAPSPATVPSLVSQAPLLLVPAATAASTAAALPGALPASCPGALAGAVAEQVAPGRSLLDELLSVTTAAERAAGVTLAADGAGTAALLQDLGAWLDWTQALASTVEDRQSCTQHPGLPASLPPTAHDRVTPTPAPPPWGQAGMPLNPDWGNTCAGSARLNALNPSYCHLMLCVVADMAAFAQAEACPALLGWLEQGTRQVLPALHVLHPGLVAALVSKQELEQGPVSGLEVEAQAGRGAGAGASGVTAADTLTVAEAGSAGVRAQAGAGSGTTGPLQVEPAGQSSLSSGTSSSSSSATLLVTLFPTFPAQGIWLQPAWSAGRAALRQLVWGFPEPGLEARYRAWLAGRASAPLRVALLLMVLIIAVTLPKSWAAGCFLYDCCYYAAYITPHLQASPLHCGAHDLLRVSNHGRLQLVGLGCTVVRAAMVVLSALGVLRWPAGTVFSAQQGVDFWLEGIIILGQQLTLGPMLFQLACTYCAAVTLNASLGVPRPWLRSLLVVGVSCVIGVVMDLRHRASFAAKQTNKLKAQTCQPTSQFLANPYCKWVYNQLQRRLVRKGQLRYPMLMPVFEDPSNQALLAKLQELGIMNMWGDNNTIGAHSMQLAVSMQQHFANPERSVKLYAKAARARLGLSGVEAQIFIKLACGYSLNADSPELQATDLDKEHVADLKKEADKHCRRLGLKQQGSLQDTIPLLCQMRHTVHVCRCQEQWQQPPTPLCQGSQSVAGVGEGIAEQREFVFDPATQIGVGIDPRDTQAIGADQETGRTGALEQFFKKLKEDMAEVFMERHGHAKQLVVFFGAAGIGTREGWGADAVLQACCKVVCRPRGAGQRRGSVVLVDEHRTTRDSSAVNGQQPCEEQLNHDQPTRPGGWKPPAGQVKHRLLRPAWSQQREQPVWGLMWCPVVAPRKPPKAPCSSQAATPAAASEPGPSTPPRAKHSKRRNHNRQRIGESRWWPLELCQTRERCQPRARTALAWATSGPVNAMVTKKRGVMARCAGAQKAREVMAQRRAAEAEAKAHAGAAEAETQAQADAGAYEADEAGADEAGAYEADAGAYEAEAQAQADARAYEAQLHQLQPELQQREQQATDTQRLQHLQQQLQDLQQDELQRKEQQVAEQQQQLQQQQADMHLREQQLAEQQHQLQQQQADMHLREQQLAEQQHQLQQQQADLQQREQHVAEQQHHLQQQQADLQQREQHVAEQQHHLQQQQADLQQREQHVAEQQHHLQQQQADLQQREQHVAEQQHHLQQQQADLQQREQHVAEQQHHLQQQQADLQQREQHVAEQQHHLQQQQADLQQREQHMAEQQHHLQLQQQLNRLQQQLEAQSAGELQRQVQQQLAVQQHLLQQQHADLLLKQQHVEKQLQEAADQQGVSTNHPLPDHPPCSPHVPESLRSPLLKRPRQDTTLAPLPRERAWQPAAQTSATRATAQRVHRAAPTVLLTTRNRFATLPVVDEQEQQLPSQPARMDEHQAAAAAIAAAAVSAVQG
ncbi:hypothetical protein QJQ45_011130 [Haematococcus lacustris]|nr:hypothetical protein QJQ45_011130 [Haematococcus lacustris]